MSAPSELGLGSEVSPRRWKVFYRTSCRNPVLPASAVSLSGEILMRPPPRTSP